jgi:hypothetical protein
MGPADINAEIARRKAAGTIGEFEELVFVRWMSADEKVAA